MTQAVRRSPRVAALLSGWALCLLATFSATAERTSAFSAFSSIASPSLKSIARRVLPSRLELKRREGSWSAAPLANVVFTTLL